MRVKTATRGVLPIAATAILLAACASEPPPSSPTLATAAHPSARAAGAACQRLFVSPSGEPFRSAEGGGCPFEAWFAQADADHDGALDLAEFRADAVRFFTTLDQDGDGVLEAEEVRRYEQVVLPEILGRSREASADRPTLRRAALYTQFGGGGQGGFGGGGGGGGGGRGGRQQEAEPDHAPAPGSIASPDGASRYGLLDEPEPVSGSDLNFDGRITRAEFMTRAAQRFETLDPQGAGRLTLVALRARLDARSGRSSGGRAGGGGRRRS